MWLWLMFLSAGCFGQQNIYYGIFRELPVSSIKPEGWLGELLQRQRTGLGLNRQVSGQPFSTDLWAGDLGDGWDRYEQTAYMVDGLYRCGLLLQAKDLIGLGEKNIRYVLSHVQADGKLGPSAIGPITSALIGLDRTDNGNFPVTQWPFAVFSRAMMAYYEESEDTALTGALTRHYLAMPENFGTAPRDVNNVEAICWLYGRTGNLKLLEMAERTWQHAVKSPNNNVRSKWDLTYMMNATEIRGHGVSVCEQSKLPAILYLYTGKKEYLQAALNYYHSLAAEHGMADGVPSSDEGLHFKHPEGVHETCVISDYSWSMGYLLQASGEAGWADRIEAAVFNAGLGAIKKDFKSHQYFSSTNQFIATRQSLVVRRYPPEHRDRQAYCTGFVTQCCTGNVHRIFPNFAARMWMSDNRGGLAATLYSSSTVSTNVGASQVPVVIKEMTGYPFDGNIRFEISVSEPVRFPLHLRIPSWARQAKLLVNGRPVTEALVPGTFFTIQREFKTGDIVELDLPMAVRVEQPMPATASIYYGPLLYSLAIKEKQMRIDNPDNTEFPAWDITAASPWNYAFVNDAGNIEIKRAAMTGFPWDAGSCPVRLTVYARKIPSWVLTADNTTPAMPVAPFQCDKTEKVELIPVGATQLRLSVFPVAGTN